MTSRLPDRYKFTSKIQEEKAKQDNIPLIFYLGAILARCAYDPPTLFMLGTITAYKCMYNHQILDKLNSDLIELTKSIETQEHFIDFMNNPENNDVPTLKNSVKLNKALKKLEDVIYDKKNRSLSIGSPPPSSYQPKKTVLPSSIVPTTSTISSLSALDTPSLLKSATDSTQITTPLQEEQQPGLSHIKATPTHVELTPTPTSVESLAPSPVETSSAATLALV